jgi:hypothetical protein
MVRRFPQSVYSALGLRFAMNRPELKHGRSLPALACLSMIVLSAIIVVHRAFAQQPDASLCRGIADEGARLKCFENVIRGRGTKSVSHALGANAGTWRMVRTPNPTGGPDALSIMQLADTKKSDLGLAGMALRCREGGVEILIVLVGALSLKLHPKVEINAAGNPEHFVATVVPPGSSLLLPPAASQLASGPWEAITELAIKIEAEQSGDAMASIQGVIPLAGLRQALLSLRASCPS